MLGSYNFGSDSYGATGGIPAATVWRLTASRIQGGVMGTDWTRIFFLGGAALGVIVDGIWFPGNGHEIHVAR